MEAVKQEVTASAHKKQMSWVRIMYVGAICATALFIAWGIIKMIL